MGLRLTRKPNSPNWYVRGTHLGIYLERSTKTSNRTLARKLLSRWREDIESGLLARATGPTFFDAAIRYLATGGEDRFIRRVLEYFGRTPLHAIDQAAIDACAAELYPHASPATQNRQVYAPVSAILRRAGVSMQIRRPKGAGGRRRTEWLRPESAFKLFAAADRIDAEFATLLRFLCYTGCRLGEAIGLRGSDISLAQELAVVRATKNGEPRGVYLPPVVVAALANHPRGLADDAYLFRWHKSGRLYQLLRQSAAAAGVELPPRMGFHLFRHTWATWMRQYAGLDARGLLGTGAWRDLDSAARYAHVVVSEESRKAALLPTEASTRA